MSLTPLTSETRLTVVRQRATAVAAHPLTWIVTVPLTVYGASFVPGAVSLLAIVGGVGASIWTVRKVKAELERMQQESGPPPPPPASWITADDHAALAEVAEAYTILCERRPELRRWRPVGAEALASAAGSVIALVDRRYPIRMVLGTGAIGPIEHPLLLLQVDDYDPADPPLDANLAWTTMTDGPELWLVVALARSSETLVGQRITASGGTVAAAAPARASDVIVTSRRAASREVRSPQRGAPQGADGRAADQMVSPAVAEEEVPAATIRPPAIASAPVEESVSLPPTLLSDLLALDPEIARPAEERDQPRPRWAVLPDLDDGEEATPPLPALVPAPEAARQRLFSVEPPLPTDPRARLIIAKLAEFGVSVQITDVRVGPRVTLMSLVPAQGVTVRKVLQHVSDMQLALGLPSLRVLTPIPGEAAIGLEVPNETPTEVPLVALQPALEAADHPLALPLGGGTTGEPLIVPLAKLPHLLVAGATGSGKSVAMRAFLCALLRNSSTLVKLVLIDPKKTEFAAYRGLPHLVEPVVTDVLATGRALRRLTIEMDRRYELLAEAGARDIDAYHEQCGRAALPYIIVVVDEYADLLQMADQYDLEQRELQGERDKDEPKRPSTRLIIEQQICRLAQKARGAGIHLIVATQRPSVDVITGRIKANFPGRLAFAVTTSTDSKVILDQAGAEALMGQGDLLFVSQARPTPIRAQGVYVSDAEVRAMVVRHLAAPPVRAPTPPTRPLVAPAAKGGGQLQEGALQALLRRWPPECREYLERRLRDAEGRRGLLAVITRAEAVGLRLPRLAEGGVMSEKECLAVMEDPTLAALIREAYEHLDRSQRAVAKVVFGGDSNSKVVKAVGTLVRVAAKE